MPDATPPAAVLCDLDGVLRHFDGQLGLEQRHGLPPGTLAAAAFGPGPTGDHTGDPAADLAAAVTGAITDEQWRARIAGRLIATCGSADRAGRLVAEWTAAPQRVDPEVLDLLTRARAAVPVALVSNATTRLEHDLDRLGLTGAVDVVVNSSRLGVAKPDPRVLRAAAAAVDVPVPDCLFVDDAPANVAAAHRLGMRALLFDGAVGLAAALAPVLS